MYKILRRKRILLVDMCIVIVLLLYAPATFTGNNRWTQLGPPNTVVEALAINPVAPDTLYAGTQDGVLKTINGGGDWTPVNTGLAGLQVLTLTMHPATPDTLYVAQEVRVAPGRNVPTVLPQQGPTASLTFEGSGYVPKCRGSDRCQRY